uniref:Tyrosine hydroxylase n=1 Tax=Hofstenia miamia TaxID=442651 RepID=A0A7G7LK74_HOFMI|nr:tyrosine hydroxylase [Hofstenia miamia]
MLANNVVEKRLKWKNSECQSWESFDFRKSFDGTYRQSLFADAMNDAQTKTSLDPVIEEYGQWEPIQLICTPHPNLNSLHAILAAININGFQVESVETGSSTRKGYRHDVMLQIAAKKQGRYNVVDTIRQFCSHISLLNQRLQTKDNTIWFPRHVSELENIGILSTVDPQFDKDHPGFNDVKYRERRKDIIKVAQDYQLKDEKIPVVAYTDVEIETWKEAYVNLRSLHQTHACKQYIEGFRLLEEKFGLCPEEIPQLRDLSAFMKEEVGYRLRPVAGLVTARDFLAHLAFRIFPCTQYIRHPSAPMHTPEPDYIHESLGHMPMFLHHDLADFSQQIGLASLGADDDFIIKLATLYWFTVEFGLIREEGKLKAYGAGLLSAYGEMIHSLSNEPKHLNFDPEVTCVQTYDDYNYQEVYFVIDSISEMMFKFNSYVYKHKKSNILQFDANTQSIRVLNKINDIKKEFAKLKHSLDMTLHAMENL